MNCCDYIYRSMIRSRCLIMFMFFLQFIHIFLTSVLLSWWHDLVRVNSTERLSCLFKYSFERLIATFNYAFWPDLSVVQEGCDSKHDGLNLSLAYYFSITFTVSIISVSFTLCTHLKHHEVWRLFKLTRYWVLSKAMICQCQVCHALTVQLRV